MSARSPQRGRFQGPIPAQAGIGLRACHHAEVLRERPPVAWFEVHSENFFAEGGALPRILERVRNDYPLSLHGVGLGLGNADALDPTHLGALRRLVDRYEPALVSEHVCWNATGGRYTNDLLPLPHTEEALRHLAERIDATQNALGRRILVENVSSYVEFADAEFTEWEFIAALANRTGCGILFDVNNVYVSAMNHGFDAVRYLEAMPRHAVGEIHLAGHSAYVQAGREFRIDTHSTTVCDAVWDLYRLSVERFGAVPALIEWDADIPPFAVLREEAAKANRIVEQAHARAA